MADQKPITVAIGHFDDLYARGLRGMIEDDPSLQLVASDVRSAQLPTMLRTRRPQVTILDAEALGSPIAVRELAGLRPDHPPAAARSATVRGGERAAARVRRRRVPVEVDADARRAQRDPPRLARSAARAPRRSRGARRRRAAHAARDRRARPPAAAALERADRRRPADQHRDRAHARTPHLPQARRRLPPRAARRPRRLAPPRHR